MRRFFVLVSVLGVVHCSSTPESPASSAAGAPPGGLVLPQSECPAGTMPVVGKTECAAVGVTACADGFEAIASGWGCKAIVPDHACTGATRARLGSRTCEPVSDCDAAFPPAGADAVVHDDAELAAALISVKSGGTIALDAGTYHGIEIGKNVHLVGRCAEKVTLAGPEKRGILVQGPKQLALEGVTIAGFKGGLVVADGATAEVDGVVFSDDAYALTVSAATAHVRRSVIAAPGAAAPTMAVGASKEADVTLTDVDVRDHATVARVWNDGKATFRRSVVAGTGGTGHLLGGYAGGQLGLEESAVLLHRKGQTFGRFGRVLEGSTSTDPSLAGSTFRVTRSELRAVDFEDPDGWLVGIHEGAKLEIEESTIDHRADAALDVRDPETAATIRSSVIASRAHPDSMRAAVTVFSGAHADIDGVAIVAPSEQALFAGDVGTHLSFSHSLVTGMETGGHVPEGREVVSAARGAMVDVLESAFLQCQGWAAGGTDDGTKLSFERTLIDPGSAMMGAGFVLQSGAEMAMSSSAVRHCADAAVTVVAAKGLVTDSFIEQNKVAVRVSDAAFVEAASATRVPGAKEIVFAHTSVKDNDEKVAPVPDWMLAKPQ